ncbi:MAG: Lrp/AsnC family transcriptional regulator [Xanthomonadales bacterium]|nr:Lrp/AsnC family transcriptional regulator [Xanthomonadales bacterium]
MTNELDDTDRRLLDLLQQHGRLTNVELAERLNLSATPVARRWRRLEEQGYISGYIALIDQKRAGFDVTAYVSVRLSANEWKTAEAFELAVKNLANVMDCSVVTGSSDYMLRVVARDLEDYERFLKRELAVIDAINTIDSTIVLNRIVSRTQLPL